MKDEKRVEFCAKIASNTWDAVIIGTSQLERIPVSLERQENFFNNQIEILKSAIKSAKESSDRWTVKQLASMQKQLEKSFFKNAKWKK